MARATDLHAAALVWDAHACLPLLPQQSMAALERHRAAGANHVSVNVGMDFNPIAQVMRVIELAFGAVAAGPIPAPVMSSAAVAEAFTVMLKRD